MKRGTPDHPKMLSLAEAIKAYMDGTRPESNLPIDMCQTLACGILERLWHFTARYAPRGDVGKCRDWSLARAVGWNFDAQSLVRMLVETGWVDQLSDGMFYIHDWHSHCDDGCDKYLRDNGLTYYNGEPPRRKPDKSERRRDKSKLVKTPEPLPKPAPAPKPPPLPSDRTKAAAAVLVELGAEAAAAHRAVEAALRVNCTPEQIDAIVAYWKNNRHWGIGALVNRISFATPKTPVDKGWPQALSDHGPTPAQLAKEKLETDETRAFLIVRNGRRAKKPDEAIAAELTAAGLEWPK